MTLMRVLMICKACGVGIYQRKLELIARQGVDLKVIVPPYWKDERGETSLERVYTEGYALDVLPIRFNGNFHLHFYHDLARTMRNFQPHIVHIDEEPYNLAAWQALWHARRIKAKTLFFSWQNIRRRYPPPFNWGERWFLNHTDYALVGTESAGEVWRQKGYSGPMKTIPQFGVDVELFHPAERDSDRPFTIGYIGRLVEEKGIHHLIEAAAQLPDVNLHLIGSGPYRDDLAAQVERLNISPRVTFTSWVPSTQMPDAYHSLDVLALPSLTRPNWKEQFGRVLIEAMASGVPVIGSDSGAIPDVIGEAGLIFPEGDVSALKEALCHLRDDPMLYQSLHSKGLHRITTHFTHQQIANQTVTVYRNLNK